MKSEYKILWKNIVPKVSGTLGIFRGDKPWIMVHEEYLNDALICCIFPPIDKPWPWPWPSPLPDPDPMPDWPFPLPLLKSVSSPLNKSITKAPIVIIVEPVKNDRDSIKLSIKIKDKSYSGAVDLWKVPYDKQEFYKFIKAQDIYDQNWGAVSVHIIEKMTREFGVSQHSVGKGLPTGVTLGQLGAWEHGSAPSPNTAVGKAKPELLKSLWATIASIAAATVGDIVGAGGGPGAAGTITTVVATANISILAESKDKEVPVTQ